MLDDKSTDQPLILAKKLKRIVPCSKLMKNRIQKRNKTIDRAQMRQTLPL